MTSRKMKFTTSKEADKKIQEDIEIIKKIVLKKYPDIKAIVMFGGFGHGGGSFKKIKKKILPLNDYDIYLITSQSLNQETLEKLGEQCSKAIGRGGKEIVENFNEKYDINEFFHVDLHNLKEEKLKKLYPFQRTFDLKTSIVIHGDKNILNQIPEIEIPVSDALRLLFNKLDHFLIAENNSDIIKSIYSVKGFTDLCSALLIFHKKYISNYEEREKIFSKMDFPDELKSLVKKATEAKLKKGYEVKNIEDFFSKSKKWVAWTLKYILKKHLNIQQDNWKDICRISYKKLPYIYFNQYLNNKYLFPAQYYLNIKFFREAARKKEFLPRSLLNWRDAGLIVAISLILYSVNEKKEAEKYLKKITSSTTPLKERILKIYSIYYLQKLI